MNLNFKKIWKNNKKKILKESKINEQITTLDKPTLLKKPSESEEDRKKREAEEKQRAMVSGIVEQEDDVQPQHPLADPTGINSLEAEDIPVAESAKRKIESLSKKRDKLSEQIKSLEEEINKARVIGEKMAAYDDARANVAKLKEELDAVKNGDVPMEEDKLPGGLADDMDNEDIAKKHGVDKKVIDKQVELGKDVEAEHTDDEEAQEEIAQDHEVEDPEYYDDPDGLDLGDVEKEAEKEKKLGEGLAKVKTSHGGAKHGKGRVTKKEAKEAAKKHSRQEGKKQSKEDLSEGKKSDKDLRKQAKYQAKKEGIKKHGASEDPHKPTQTIEDKKSKGKKAKGKHGTREAGKKAAREAMLKENKQKYLKEAWKRVNKSKTDTDGFVSLG